MKRKDMIFTLSSLVMEAQESGRNIRLELHLDYIWVFECDKEMTRFIFSEFIHDGEDRLYIRTINKLNNVKS